MTKTGSITPCCSGPKPRHLPEQPRTAGWRSGLAALRRAWLLLVLTLLLPSGVVRAQGIPLDIATIQAEQAEDGLFLSANLRIELPTVIEDALGKGIAMTFVAESEVLRPRWYWTDRSVARASRYLRLAYQPLTRRWRLTVSSGPQSQPGLGVSLGQTFDSLPEALGSIQRIARWKIAEASEIEADAAHKIEFRFRLDVSQLPRPFQLGAVGQAEWNLSISRRLNVEAAR